jgi:hypothetical protein
MPYITQEERAIVDSEVQALITRLAAKGWNEGMVNYSISTILWEWFHQLPGYKTVNAVVGVLGCVKDEFYRRLASEYEDYKRVRNGDLKAFRFWGDGK